ncbi:hypothetical protein ATO12_23715 [Aquimarina atlantica]|uniref:Response regulatory domain-containing protein n=2 Tax=Aquimarina atlantica TaxID=1317122 RepID=A0A023BRK1_9FLAO|nr:hypothetical protein ATO12_23715 [Aquimarina atlantica]
MLKSINAGVQIIGECESVQEAIIVTKSCEPELVFLDINLTDGNSKMVFLSSIFGRLEQKNRLLR